MEASASIEIAKHTLLSCGLDSGDRHARRPARAEDQDSRRRGVPASRASRSARRRSALIDIKADSALNQIILLFGASYILFDGGASLRLEVLKQVWITIVVIATVGVVITAAITGLAAHYILGVPADRGAAAGRDAGLDRSGNAGADLPPDPHPRPRRANRDERVRLQRRHGRDPHLQRAGGRDRQRRVLARRPRCSTSLKQSVIGIVAGIVLGYLAALLIAHEQWAFLAEYAPVVTLVAVIGAYFAADGLQASRLHGGVRVRHRARQQGSVRLSDGAGRSAEARGVMC